MFNQNVTIAGLQSYSVGVPTAGPYFVEGKISIPTITNGGGQSSVVATVNQNGSPIYTGVAGAEGFRTDLLCAAADVIQIVLSSAAAPDLGLNNVKATVAIGSGV